MSSEVKISDAIPGAAETHDNIARDQEKEGYGHGPVTLAFTIAANDRMNRGDVEDLRKRALSLIEQYGDKIIDVMTPELRAALGIEKASS